MQNTPLNIGFLIQKKLFEAEFRTEAVMDADAAACSHSRYGTPAAVTPGRWMVRMMVSLERRGPAHGPMEGERQVTHTHTHADSMPKGT